MFEETVLLDMAVETYALGIREVGVVTGAGIGVGIATGLPAEPAAELKLEFEICETASVELSQQTKSSLPGHIGSSNKL